MVRVSPLQEDNCKEVQLDNLQAENNLFEFEDRQNYKAVFDSVNDVIMVLDRKGKIRL